ncbi:hypothetical protein NEPTK9_001454 [Candidatus Neptunochlamydia vexilliferae]|uniref:HTH deoR-type domain-containing protein n=2 Tax=Candidatus Neptunichlamydia vexilliferae TaxID=1651774 RepID=A0ABS0B0L9_9BACT|nr:hypothetical protein [Candidatus Neptunochlamydia vexilliferae]
MSMLGLGHLLNLPEGRTLEFKQDMTSLKPILKTLIAFANTAGGTLVIGRSDDGKILGIKNVLEAEERLANAIADSVAPPLIPKIEIVSTKGQSLIVVRVPYWSGPFYLKSAGKSQGVYIRLGSTNRAAGEEFLAELKRSVKKVGFDQMPCPEVGESGLDKDRLDKAFAKIGKKVSTQMLKTLNILVPYGDTFVCSNGGVILFGKDEYRSRLFPNAEVRCARFRGTTKTHFIDHYDVDGTILEAMYEVPKFIQRNTRLAARIEKIQRKDIPEYSPLVIREVLANALVHADYSLLGMNPRVAIFSDRMEVESPGMAPFGFVFADFFSGISHVRNKVIARVFRELNIIEEWGTGYKRIEDACHEEGYPIPNWLELGASIRVALKPHPVTLDAEEHPVKEALTERQEEIIALFQGKEKLTTKEVHKKMTTTISERTLRNDLSAMQKKGVIKMVGRGPGAQWKLVGT